jgi:hypothetical protein
VPLAAPTALQVDGDAAARQSIDRIRVRARRVPGSRERLSSAAPLHIARYGRHVVYLMSGDAFIEREGAWVAGGRLAEFLIAPDPGVPIRLFVRNAPVENRVTLESGTWRQELALGPGEERLLDVPVPAGRNGVLLRVTSAAGFRPSDIEEGSRDQRLLGSWIETR